ncbi:type II secretion system F family protein [Psychromonas sp. Urea-02u-13]|uniref:type II secretion system F family protein n=1 Tax=Psychromonas sp. Urea-02u-13 TaxID=2058326 RepID=UPI000C31F2E5|nr:type II secretion system F family protein [Psychromonas sp. Urea-02u-13]PKG39837.1 MSHA biogenesis protein MshG [Psychromonas sp. Urea-02u-13]
MALFKYVGRDAQGNSVKGEVEASSIDTAADQVMQKGVLPSSIKEKKAGAENLDLSLIFASKVNPSDLIVFTRQIYSLTKAGIPILRAINGLAESTHSVLLSESLQDVLNRMRNGYSLSAAMGAHPRVFSQLYVSLIQVGENTGQLDRIFLQLSEYLEQEIETRKRVKSAMRYPTFVLIALAVAMVILNIYVIPTFAGMFAKFHAELPWTTQVLLGTSSFFVDYWHLMLIFLISAFIGLKLWLNSPKGAYLWDKWKLKIPVVGSVIERSLLARFSRSFAMMLSAGVPLNNALYLIAHAVDNNYLQEKILAMRSGIEAGDPLLKTATAAGLFTPLVLQMIAVGEETGQVDELLNEAADFYEREVDYELKNMTAKIEPILISIVAGMVLILALGIFTPMWDMMGAMKGG